MTQQQSATLSQNDLLLKAQQLLTYVKKENEKFERTTADIVSRAETLEIELDGIDIDKQLRDVEENALKAMDKVVVDYIEALDEQGKADQK